MAPLKKITKQQYFERLVRDYVFFVHEVWTTRKLDRYHKLTWAEDELLDWAANGPSRRILLAPRETGKSSLVTQLLPLWLVLRDQNWRTIILSKNGKLAQGHVRTMRGIIDEVWFLNQMRPRRSAAFKDAKGAKDAAAGFDIQGAQTYSTPSILSLGMEGSKAGWHGGLILGDDIEADGNCETVALRDKTETTFSEFASLRFSKKAMERSINQVGTLLVGTYHPASDSLYERLAGGDDVNGRYDVRTWPMVGPESDWEFLGLSPKVRQRVAAGKLKPGQIIFTGRHTQDDVDYKRASSSKMSPHYFDRQFLLRTQVSAVQTRPISLRNLIVHPCPPIEADYPLQWGEIDESGSSTQLRDLHTLCPMGHFLMGPAIFGRGQARYEKTVCYVDPAAGGKDSAAIAIISIIGGMVYVQASIGYAKDRAFSNDKEMQNYLYGLMHDISGRCRHHRVDELVVERNYSGGIWGNQLYSIMEGYFVSQGGRDTEGNVYEDGWSCIAGQDTARTQKEERLVSTISPLVADHRIVIDPEAIKVDPSRDNEQSLQYQLAYITSEKGCLREYGRMDALSGAIAWVENTFKVDPSSMRETVQQAQRRYQEESDARRREMRQFGRISESSWKPSLETYGSAS